MIGGERWQVVKELARLVENLLRLDQQPVTGHMVTLGTTTHRGKTASASMRCGWLTGAARIRLALTIFGLRL
jgi:hypothetical protein